MAQKQTAQSGRSTSNRKSTTDGKKTTRATPAPKTAKRPKPSGKTPTAKQNTPGNARAPKTGSTAKATSDKKDKTTQAKPRQRVTKRPEIALQPGIAKRALDAMRSAIKTLQDPVFWQRVVQKLPSWTDEVGAILLIVASVVMLTALLNTTSEAALSITLSRVLRQLFGYGAYVVSLIVLGIGVLILLPKFGITLHIGWTRTIALEAMFGAFAALLHLFANDPETHALAREGKGGGFLGWALMQIPYTLVGQTIAILIFGIIFAAGLVMITGLRLYHLTLGIAWLNTRLQNSISRLDSMSFEPTHNDYEDEPSYTEPNPGTALSGHGASNTEFTHISVTPRTASKNPARTSDRKTPDSNSTHLAEPPHTPASDAAQVPPKRPNKPSNPGPDTTASRSLFFSLNGRL